MTAPTRTQLRIMRRIHEEGLLLLAESDCTCWLFDVDETPGGTYEERYRPVERVSGITAERLVLRGFVRGSGSLTPLGRQFVDRARPHHAAAAGTGGESGAVSRIGEAIKAEREACGLAVKEVEAATGLPVWVLEIIESGRYTPNDREMLLIANVFPESVDTGAWYWLLLADWWGEPIADLMRKHATMTVASGRGGAVEGGEG